MEIVMPRGDLRRVTFSVLDTDGQPYDGTLSEIFVTVKDNFRQKNARFQKTLTGGDITDLSEGEYRFTIEPEDTDGLSFGQYAFDIEVIGENIKQTFTGILRLTEEATHACNEGEAGV